MTMLNQVLANVLKFDADVADTMEKTQRVMAIQAKIEVQKTTLATNLETALADGKLTRGENNKLRKEIDAWVDDAIAGVKTDTEAKAAALAAALDGIAGLSEDSKAKIIAAAEANGDQQIAELQGYQDELNALLESMKGGSEAITADKIARYNELLDLIATMKSEIAAANEGLEQYYAAQQTFMESGKATPAQAQAYTTLGIQVAGDEYAAQEQARKEAIIAKQAALEAAQQAGDGAAVVTIKQDITTAFENEEAAKQEYADKITGVLNGGVDAALTSVTGGENRLTTLLNDYLKAGFLQNLDPKKLAGDSEMQAKLKEVLGGVLDIDLSATDLSDTEVARGSWLAGVIEMAKTQLTNGIAAEMETGDFNPILEMLKSSMDGVDLSGIDTSKLSGSVKALFAMLDFKTGGGEVSQDIWQGVADGLTDNAGAAKTAMTEENNNLIAAVKAQWGIQSPSTVMKGIFTNVMLGAAAGITENAALLTAPFAAMATTDFPRLGAGMMDALIQAVNNRSEAFKAAIRNSVRNAMAAAQLVADQGVRIPVTLVYTDPSAKKFSQSLGL